MADNIKIVGDILNTTIVTRYSSEDTNLISSTNLQENFGETGDYIEYFIYDAGGNLLNNNYNYLNYKLPPSTNLTPEVSSLPNTTGNIQTTNIGVVSTLASSTSSLYPIIEIDPVNDLKNTGYSSGEFKVRYNLFYNILSNSNDRALFIKEISQDRTEIRLASTTLTNDEIESTVNNIINQINSSSYYVDYLLNFGDNQQYVAVNIALNKVTTGYEVLFKMYEPLPPEVQEKQTLWVVEEKTPPYIFDINLDTLIIPPPPPTLRGPNFSIPIPNQGTISTTYIDYSTALLNLQSLQSSSYQQLLNLMTTQSISINVDYTNFNNFTFFGSAYQRVTNFYTKVKQIEDYTNLIKKYTPYVATTASLQTEINQYSSDINTLVSQFDGYETYLYFESSSYTWPKSGSIKPYSLLSTGSAAVITWYNTLTGSAQTYDNENYDNLVYAVPNFIRDDANNNQYLTFLNMVGQYFDNIWIYLKAITDINLANNNLNVGISKDLVYNQLQSLGIKLYNSQAGESVDQFLIGANTGSNVFDNNFSITGSYLNNIPRKDLLAELYKRIYHNLPLLLKTKGTKPGLEYLITTFGIPSRTYITGSIVSSSILDVKEYGGALKSNLVKGYNNEKVRIVQNTVTGSVLSSLLSLQTYPTASAQSRENDNQYIDISFSPETQIDTYVSGAIASNNPTWSLDDYIGDPRQLYSPSYFDLDAQRKLYFETGVPGFPGFTGSYMDYNGFIRLIQFFDNALFKMLNDFVPERASLSTGITINSPVLERNKAAYSIPYAYTQSVYEAEYSASTISSQYGNFYNALSSSNNTSGWFNGELSGSTVNIYQYFTDNYNPYLYDWNVYNAQHNSTQSINTNTFLHSDWNVLLNNVSQSVLSIYRQNIEYVWGTTGSILKPAELQDSYLSLRSYNTSRYEGSKTTSQLYNTYTDGDDSYGKTAAINHNVRKIGIFTQIETSSFLPKRNNVRLKYLVDEFGSLTELNQINKNWEDIQRTFMVGDTGSVSLFDNRKYSNQKSTDGEKLIFDSGYNYSPILYGNGYNTRLYFDRTGEGASYQGTANFLSSSYFISGSSTLGYPIVNGKLTKLYNNVIEGSSQMVGGISTNPPVYTIPEGGAYNINADLTITMKNTNNYGSASFTLQTYLNGSTYGIGSTQVFTFSLPGSNYLSYSTPYVIANPSYQEITLTGTQKYSTKVITISSGPHTGTYPIGTSFYDYTSYNLNWYTGSLNVATCRPNSNPIINGVFSFTPTIYLADVSSECDFSSDNPLLKEAVYNNIIVIPDFDTTSGEQTIIKTFNVSFTSPSNLVKGDTVSASLNVNFIQSSIAPYFTASINPNSIFRVTSLSNSVGNYPFTSLEYFTPLDDAGAVGLPNNQLAFSPGLTSFYTQEYQFLPYYTSGSTVYSSSLYSKYGDVDYPFQLGIYDIFAAYDISGSYFETRITNIETKPYNNNQYLILTFADDIPASLNQYDPSPSGQLLNLTSVVNKPAEFLFLKRTEDETNINLKYQKRPGQTSYGFLIPENLAPDILENIDTITKQVKQKLLADQQGTVA